MNYLWVKQEEKLSFLLCEHPPALGPSAQQSGAAAWCSAPGLALCSASTASCLAPPWPTQLSTVSLRPLEDIFWDVGLPQGTGRGYSGFVTNKIIVHKKELVKDQTDLQSDSHVVKSVP